MVGKGAALIRAGRTTLRLKNPLVQAVVLPPAVNFKSVLFEDPLGSNVVHQSRGFEAVQAEVTV